MGTQLIGRTIVITGGSSGIGLELVKRLQAENRLIVIGRDKEKLRRLEATGIATFSMDIADPDERRAFFRWLDDNYPEFDTLINNAGWSQHHKLSEQQDWPLDNDDHSAYQNELRHNLEAHISMSLQALPRLLKRPNALLVNVTTGLVYAPKASMPFYCAAKAGLHSFTQSIRHQMKSYDIRIVEVMPPLVNTPFHVNGLPDTVKAMTPQMAAKETILGLKQDGNEIHIGLSKLANILARLAPKLGFQIVNRA